MYQNILSYESCHYNYTSDKYYKFVGDDVTCMLIMHSISALLFGDKKKNILAPQRINILL